jgi:uncharacterized protein YbjT (DUF2867 family)
MAGILVIGAHGTVGTELSRLLVAQGRQVRRATSRTPSHPDEVQVNVVTGAGREAAFEGVGRAFLLAPPGYVNQDALLNPLVDAAVAAGLRKVVLMSAMGANADPAAPLRKAELHLEASGLAWNVIRPTWFMQNFNSFWLQGIVEHDTIGLPVGRAKGGFIDTRDIAAVAAKLLVDDTLSGRDFDLTGPETLDHDRIAEILSRVVGRPIRFSDISPEAMLDRLLQAGLPRDYAEFMIRILDFFKAGYSDRTTDAVQTITGSAPRRFETYAQDYRTAWQKRTSA